MLFEDIGKSFAHSFAVSANTARVIKKRKPRSICRVDEVVESGRLTILHSPYGDRPAAGSGIIQYGPLKNKETWANLNHAFIHGYKGFSATPYRSLTECFDGEGVHSCSGVFLANVLEAVHETTNHDGKRPSVRRGKIRWGVLAQAKIDWAAVNAHFKTGRFRDSGFTSLKHFMDAMEIPFPATAPFQGTQPGFIVKMTPTRP